MADGGGSGEAAAARTSPVPVPGLNPTLGWRERLRAGLAGTGVSVWLVAGLGLLYALRIPLRLCENLAAGERTRPPGAGRGARRDVGGKSQRARDSR